ncbi:MAG: DEAD/DEAH box helicase family protein [Candidatus Nomurabacteria bacterium]|jgi:type III restriction enzyme|nr:DEAD/DEAH box helicase family protein [Candidatus Nomurabacteria bacterium]
MKLQFENNLDYQLEAISAVVDIFEGQPYVGAERVELDTDERQMTIEQASAIRNLIKLDDEQVLENIKKIQQQNNVWIPDQVRNDNRNFTVEMETGTGKTYVYLRTIHELRQKYGWKKFIIVVPSVAIKEGVLKNLEITKEHFAGLYGNPEMDYYVWDAKKKGQARQFATNDSLQIMVITIDSFAKATNIMNSASDYGTPLNFIKATNPIVIVDEPQNMETEKRKAAIESLNLLCTLRYSATHKNYYNLMYSLNPVDAYDKGLVKKIEVDSVMSEDSYNGAYIKLEKIERKGKSGLLANVEVDVDDKVGLQRKFIKLSPGDDLAEITGREVYDGYILDRIYVDESSIELTNGKVFFIGQKDESIHEDILKYQIEKTVENHFEKELKIARNGQKVKVLSLFFIDKVANYREYVNGGAMKGRFASWFEEAYEKISAKPRFAEIANGFTAEQVHNGYFAADKKSGEWKDSRDGEDGGKTKDDDSAYELIMKKKEQLLSMSEPVKFIFSHSALREGWDNPNVFNICTLNETSSEMKKRQEIGRGLRLPVDSDGERIRDDGINILTVVANESYDDFSRKLQTEIETETGVSFGGRIKNKSERKTVKLTKRLELDESFKELWDKIKFKTRYAVEFSDDDLARETVELLEDVVIKKAKITNLKTRITKMAGGLDSVVADSGYAKDVEYSVSVPNVLKKISEQTKITRQVAYEILDESGLAEKILTNPQQVIDETVTAITKAMTRLMVDGIKYEKTGESWDMQKFENSELEKYIYDQAAKSGALEVHAKDKTIYDFVDVDSENEKNYLEELEANEKIRFFIKLPAWFKIDTPLGTYNPDWAVVFDGDERVYFVSETKSVNDVNDGSLRQDERDKILAGREHFKEIGVGYIAPTNSLQDTLTRLAEDR